MVNIIEFVNQILVAILCIIIAYFVYKGWKIRTKCTNKEHWITCYWDELRGNTYDGT